MPESAEEDEKEPEPPAPPPVVKLKSLSCRLWRRGLNLSKKAAIAGAAITSAPLVIPPLLVGLAFAFPFAVYFAGFTFTDQVMASLFREGEQGGEEEVVDKLRKVVDLVGAESGDEAFRRLVEEGAAKEKGERVKNKQVEVEGDECNHVPAEHDIEMWPPTTALEVQREEVDAKEALGDQRFVEEVRERKLGNISKEQETNIKPTIASSVDGKEDIMGDTDNEGLKGSAEEGILENQTGSTGNEQVEVRGNESDLGTADNEIVMWPPTTALKVQREEENHMEGMGIEEQRFVEDGREGKIDNDSEQETKIKPMIAFSVDDRGNIIGDTGILEVESPVQVERGAEEVEKKKEMGVKEQRFAEDVRERKIDNDSKQEAKIKPKVESFVKDKGDIIGDTGILEVERPVQVERGAEEIDTKEVMGIEDERSVEDVGERKIDNDTEQEASIKPKTASSVDGKGDMVEDSGILEVEKPVQDERRAEEIELKEEPEKSREEEFVKRKVNKEEEIGTSENELLANVVSSEAVEENPTIEVGEGNADVETAAVVHFDNEGLGSVKEGEMKELSPIAAKEQVEVEGSDLVTAEQETEMRPRTNLEIKKGERDNIEGMEIGDQKFVEEVKEGKLDNILSEHDAKVKPRIASFVEGKEDLGGVTGMLEQENDKEEMGRSGEKVESKKEKLIEEDESGRSDFISPVDLNMDEKLKADQEAEVIQVASVMPATKTLMKEVMLEESREKEPEVIHDTGAMLDTETLIKEVMSERRSEEEIEDRAQGENISAVEADKLTPSFHHYLASIPEKWEMREDTALSSQSESSGNEVDVGEREETNNKAVIEQEIVEPVHGVIEQLEVRVSSNEVAFETLVVMAASRKAGGKIGEANAEVSGIAVDSLDTAGGEIGEDSLDTAGGEIGEANAEVSSIAVDSLDTAGGEIGEANAEVSGIAVDSLDTEQELKPSSLSTEYASAVEDQLSEMTDADNGAAVIVVETVSMVHSEISYNEEMKMWEEIHALRTIVGCKDTLRSSLVEELKALYLFTGVEPPATLKDSADLVEVDNKLQFLKSIIGVE